MAFQSDFCAYIATHSETAKGVIFFITCAFGRTPTLYHCPPKQGKKGRNSVQLLSHLFAAIFGLAWQKNF